MYRVSTGLTFFYVIIEQPVIGGNLNLKKLSEGLFFFFLFMSFYYCYFVGSQIWDQTQEQIAIGMAEGLVKLIIIK